MRQSNLSQEGLRHQKQVEIPFEHLHDWVKKMVELVKTTRRARGVSELAVIGSPFVYSISPEWGFGHLTGGIGSRTFAAYAVRTNHELVHSFMRASIFNEKFRTKYPSSWSDALSVQTTHPIFYIKANGNLVFLRESNAEYFRYRVQEELLKGTIRKLGIHPWRFRFYMRPPRAPESVKKKVTRWLKERREKKEQRKRERVGKPATVGVTIHRSKQAPNPRRTHRPIK